MSTRERAAWASAGLLAMAMAAFALWTGPSPPAEPDALVRFNIGAPQGRGFGNQPGSLALSPDGRMLAFVAPNTLARSTLWVRPLDSVEAREIQIDVHAPSWAAASPAWSPDGKQLVMTAGTSAGGTLRRVDLAGGPVLTLADWGSNAIWGNAGVVIYMGRDGTLYRVNASGGTSTQVTKIDASTGENRHVASGFLPDGRRFLFNAQHPDLAKSALYVGSIDGGARVLVPDVKVRAHYADGYLWYQQDGTLFARRFDPAAATVTGDAMPVAENIDTFAVSARTLVTNPRDVSGRTMAWFDGSGKATEVGPANAYQGTGKPDLSRDGTKLTFARRDGSGNLDIWVLELERNVASRLTTHSAEEFAPVFSHDGSRVIFGSNRGGAWGLYQRAIDGSGAEELLYESSPRKAPTGVSPDGMVLLFGQTMPETGADLWALPMVPDNGKRTPVPVSVTESLDGFGVFSPDSKWIAYCGGDGAEGDQIYVVPYPVTGARKRLSSTFGSSPRWSANGRELFFGTPDGTIMRVEITTSDGVVQAGAPTPWLKLPTLFTHLAFLPDRAATRALGPVGQHSATQSLTVTVNWRALVGK